MFVLNAPYNGGTHLPDITVCTPVFDEAGKAILFWAASRGHHADVGGVSPGSMSPRATNIHEEGVYIDNFLLVDRHASARRSSTSCSRSGPYPARNPLQNVNDLKAQIAANEKGAQELQAHGRPRSRSETVQAYMGHVQDNAAESVRRVIDRLKDSEFQTRDGSGRDHQGEDHRRQGRSARRRSISPARRRSRRPISTRPSRSRARRCSMSSA